MTKAGVNVTTLEQWKSVLDIWFKQGYVWADGDKDYNEQTFKTGGRFLFLNNEITYSYSNPSSKPFIKYSEFLIQQKEVKTYYVTQEQLDLIDELQSKTFPIDFLILNSDGYFKPLTVKLTSEEAKALLRYLGDDKTIEFKVKEPLYRLWRVDLANDVIYMKISESGTPTWTYNKNIAFTKTYEEIKKWQTPAWDIEEAN